MGIFGTTTPKFVTATGTILLPNSILVPTYVDARYIEQISVENGERTIEYQGDYSEFQVIMNIFKEGNDVAVETKFNEIYAERTSIITQFFPHADGVSIKDSGGSAVEFSMTDFNVYYLDNLDPSFRVRISMTFKSLEYTNITQSIP